MLIYIGKKEVELMSVLTVRQKVGTVNTEKHVFWRAFCVVERAFMLVFLFLMIVYEKC